MTAAARDLSPLLKPRAIALIGASDDAGKIRGRILAQLLKGGFKGRVCPIHPSRDTIQGLPAYPSVGRAPGPIDLALVAIPAAGVPDVLLECAAAGVKAAFVYSSGFAEEGGEAAALQQRVQEIARATCMVVGGPNVVGFLNVSDSLVATFSPAVDFAALPALRADPRDRRIGIISQSGGLGFALFNRGLKRRLPFSYVVNTGNEVDLDATEVAEFMLDDSRTGVVLMFLESIRRGRRFVALAERALTLGKPLIVAKIGRSAAGRRAAASHTASLTGQDRVYDSVFRRYGVVRVEDQDDMLDIAAACALSPLPAGRRVGIVTISGGVGGWLADTLASQGLEVPEFGAALQSRIRTFLPSYGAAFNPIDITAQAIGNDHRLRSVATLEDSDEIDAVAVVSSLAADARLPLEKPGLAEIAAQRRKPVLFYSYPLPSERALDDLAEIGFPCYTSLRGVAASLGALADIGEARRAAARPIEPPDLRVDRDAVRALLAAAGPVLCEYEAKEILRRYGIATAPERLARDRNEAIAAAREIGFPVALKIQSPDLPHKSDIGGVVLNLAGDEAVGEAHDAILARVRAARPDALLHGVLVQAMARPGLEAITGIDNDPGFGPQVVVGLGGVHVEILDDVALTPAPLDRRGAERLIGSLRGARLFGPVRGVPPRDRPALADLLARLAAFAADFADEVAEVDLNPVLVHAAGEGVTLVDALIVRRAMKDEES